LFVLLLPAGIAAAAGDPDAGKAKSETCLGCHASPNYFNVYPSYRVPKLAGQRPEYIVASLQAYQAGKRDHGTMEANAANLSEQDMQDIAAYLSAAPSTKSTQTTGNPAAGEQKSTVCASCHGPAGISTMPASPGLIVPHIAGQYTDYLAKTIKDYRDGVRQDPSMAGMVAGLSDADIEDLAAYYASLPGLNVVKH
jgi:cytochrome c553